MNSLQCYVLGYEQVTFEPKEGESVGSTMLKLDLYDPSAETNKYQSVWISPTNLKAAGFTPDMVIDWDEVQQVEVELGGTRLGAKVRPLKFAKA